MEDIPDNIAFDSIEYYRRIYLTTRSILGIGYLLLIQLFRNRTFASDSIFF